MQQIDLLACLHQIEHAGFQVAVRKAHHRIANEVAETDDVELHERMPGTADQLVTKFEKALVLRAVIPDLRQVRSQHEFDVPRRGTGQQFVRIVHNGLHLDAWVPTPKVGDGVVEQYGRRYRAHPETHATFLCLAHGADARIHLCQGIEHRLGPLGDDVGKGSGGHRASRAIEKHDAQPLFDSTDGLAQRGLGYTGVLGGAIEAQRTVQQQHVTQLVQRQLALQRGQHISELFSHD